MYAWNSIRTVCVVLILIPIVHLVYLVSRDTLASLNNSPDAWESELADYASSDNRRQLPDKPVVVVGGMRVKLWPGLDDLLAPHPVLMRGLGDAIVDDIIYNYVSLIGFYRPEAVVFLPSHSEFHVRDDKSASDLVEGIQELAAIDGKHRESRQLVIFTPLKTPLYPGDDQRIDEVITHLQTWAQDKPRITVLDANALLTDPEGRPRPHYFRSDGVHLNEHGYLRLSLMLMDAIAPPAASPPA